MQETRLAMRRATTLLLSDTCQSRALCCRPQIRSPSGPVRPSCSGRVQARAGEVSVEKAEGQEMSVALAVLPATEYAGLSEPTSAPPS